MACAPVMRPQLFMQFIADESQLIWQFEVAWFNGSNAARWRSDSLASLSQVYARKGAARRLPL